jgi:hypothetical protein
MLLGDWIPKLLTDQQQPDSIFRFGADASGQQNPTPDLLVSDPSVQAPQQTTLMGYPLSQLQPQNYAPDFPVVHGLLSETPMDILFELIPAPYRLAAKIIAVVALCGVLLFAWHRFTEHYVDIGKASRQIEVDTLKLQLQKSTFAGQQCNVSVDALQAASDKKKVAYAQALEDSQKRAVGLQDQSDWLLAQLNKPDAKNKGCADALKEWRVQR